ncbi:MAG: hypothetical protein ACJAYO_002688, partial [Thalassolituus oleivorans]
AAALATCPKVTATVVANMAFVRREYLGLFINIPLMRMVLLVLPHHYGEDLGA